MAAMNSASSRTNWQATRKKNATRNSAAWTRFRDRTVPRAIRMPSDEMIPNTMRIKGSDSTAGKRFDPRGWPGRTLLLSHDQGGRAAGGGEGGRGVLAGRSMDPEDEGNRQELQRQGDEPAVTHVAE